VGEPIESGTATLAACLLFAERCERITAVSALTLNLLVLAESSERVTAITTAVADMLLRARQCGVHCAPRLGLRRIRRP
jgi:hypothetical protein